MAAINIQCSVCGAQIDKPCDLEQFPGPCWGKYHYKRVTDSIKLTRDTNRKRREESRR